MPNWCDTNITIYCEDEKRTEAFFHKLEEWTSVNYKVNAFGLKWLGNIVGNSGIGKIGSDGKSNVPCRGVIFDMMLHNSKEISITTETAWAPMLEMWQLLIEKYLPSDTELIYAASEPGCEIFTTNDSEINGKYHIDSWDEMEDFERYCISEEELVVLLQGILKTKEARLPYLIKKFDESEFSDCMSIHQWEFVSPDEWI